MSKRDRRAAQGLDIAEDGYAVEVQTVEELSRTGYGLMGDLDKVGGDKIVAKPTSIFEIHPDPTQPRRAIPSIVLNSWNYGDPRVLYHYWMNFVVVEWTGDQNDFNDASMEWLHYRVMGGFEERFTVNGSPGPVERSILEVADLASSIYRDGLTNPITVVRDQGGYVVETGERRWLAYHLLYEITKDERWGKIPARTVDRLDVFRQAAENGQRKNLTAIARARQYAILVMGLNPNTDYLPYHQCVSDQAYYAQALNLSVYGKNEQILNAMNLKDRSAVSDLKKAFQLRPDQWLVADDEAWSIRQIIELLGAPNNSSATNGNLPRPKQTQATEYQSLSRPEDVKRSKELHKMDSRIEGYEPSLKAWVRQHIADERAWLDELEQFLGE